MSCNNKYVKPYHFKHKETLTFVRLSNFEERKEQLFQIAQNNEKDQQANLERFEKCFKYVKMCQFYGYIAWFVSESSFENLLGFVTTSYQNIDNPAMMKIENTSKTLINQYNAL